MRRFLPAVVAACLLGCGLLSSDVALIRLRMPPHDFRIDTGEWSLAGGNKVPTVACSAGCAEARDVFCGSGSCATECDEATQTCQVKVTIAVRNDYDLATEAPELQPVADQPVISVTVDRVYFDIDDNTLSTATPRLYLYMGPTSIQAATDEGAQLVGIIDPLPAGTEGRVDVRFEGNGQQVMKKHLDDYRTPFRVLVTGTTTVHSGEDLPTGRLLGKVQADAHVGL